ncbi:GNAT family N-acetyltransferase [Microbacterium sp. cf332]|uniref:GNAT family N-acetyltransferase n=1 Tax=Microbacterium sp. cf332 TaxID=1761804 RepID=UPI00087E3A7F|nr:GNAT family protein [Microbacterium sp. cf332]SDQ88790.1 ribosomal-protein-alanine N-acetyltransferase [Microbacterium sp. cf332]
MNLASIDIALSHGVSLRSIRTSDAAPLAEAYLRNSEHLAPYEPLRTNDFHSEAGQQTEIAALIAGRDAETTLPLVLADGSRIIGRITLSGIVRGAFQSGNLGYWIDQRYAGRGLMTATVNEVSRLAATMLELHRIQAGTLVDNVASQTVLTRCGFVEFGLAPAYLRIAGRWQDHRLFQKILEA